MPKTPVTNPFKAMEEEAYHAFREWPIFLVLRQKELATHLSPTGATSNAPGAAKTGQRPETELTKGKKT